LFGSARAIILWRSPCGLLHLLTSVAGTKRRICISIGDRRFRSKADMPPMSRACRSGASLLEPGHTAPQKELSTARSSTVRGTRGRRHVNEGLNIVRQYDPARDNERGRMRGRRATIAVLLAALSTPVVASAAESDARVYVPPPGAYVPPAAYDW